MLTAGRSKLLSYFALAFAISWGGVLLVIGSGSIPGTPEQTDRLFPWVYLAMLAGPTFLWAVVWKGGSHARHIAIATVH